MLNVTVHLHNGVKIAPANVVSFTDTTVTVRDQWGESEMQRAAIERVTTPLGAPLTLEQASA